MLTFLGQGKIPIPVGIKLLEEILPLLLRLVCSLVRKLLVDDVPINLRHLCGDYAHKQLLRCAYHERNLRQEVNYLPPQRLFVRSVSNCVFTSLHVFTNEKAITVFDVYYLHRCIPHVARRRNKRAMALKTSVGSYGSKIMILDHIFNDLTHL